ncbi:membrane-associated protein, putative [Bodo saltans]|uniref:Membrane-associated protein, putative n=1 Tax=Bodo saltans TaxID=75058 RepID=A0A0S4J657_BODSA|nr:membrane-associated protein, putative [Bodo saltans]|eukprot:CUG67800.1 membrane-associated protein, putative [Bodo saltans]
MSTTRPHCAANLFALFAAILAATATGTLCWMRVIATLDGVTVTEDIGLFQDCVYSGDSTNDEICVDNIVNTNVTDVVCGERTVGDVNMFFRALQILSILSAIFDGGGFLFAIFRCLCIDCSLGNGLLEAIFSSIGTAFAFSTWTLFIYGAQSWLYCGTSLCSVAESAQAWSSFDCEYHISLSMSIGATFFSAVSAGIFFRNHAKCRRLAAYTTLIQ